MTVKDYIEIIELKKCLEEEIFREEIYYEETEGTLNRLYADKMRADQEKLEEISEEIQEIQEILTYNKSKLKKLEGKYNELNERILEFLLDPKATTIQSSYMVRTFMNYLKRNYHVYPISFDICLNVLPDFDKKISVPTGKISVRFVDGFGFTISDTIEIPSTEKLYSVKNEKASYKLVLTDWFKAYWKDLFKKFILLLNYELVTLDFSITINMITFSEDYNFEYLSTEVRMASFTVSKN